MAVAYVDSNFGTVDSSGVITTSGSDTLVIAGVMADQVADPALGNVTHNADLLTFQQSTGGSVGDWIEVWSRIAPDAGSFSVDVAGGVGGAVVMAASFSGVHQTTPHVVRSALESAGDTQRSDTVPDMTADDIAFAFIAINGQSTGMTVDGTLQETNTGAGWAQMLITKTGTGSVTIGASGFTSARCSIVAGRIAAAGGGGGGGASIAVVLQNYRNMGLMQ